MQIITPQIDKLLFSTSLCCFLDQPFAISALPMLEIVTMTWNPQPSQDRGHVSYIGDYRRLRSSEECQFISILHSFMMRISFQVVASCCENLMVCLLHSACSAISDVRNGSLSILSRMKESFESESLGAMSPALITISKKLLYMKFLIYVQGRERKGDEPVFC